LEDPKASLEILPIRHTAYLAEAQRLQRAYASQIHILIGFEGEFIRPEFGPLVKELAAASPAVDYFIGSVHHVHSIPIDYDATTYAAAVAASNKPTEEGLFEDYYDLQYEMLRALQPRIVGHFDLIRLLSSKPGRDLKEWKGVWDRVKRNLALVREQGGWLECNTSALRKGLEEPYPCRQIAEVRYQTHLARAPIDLYINLTTFIN
jgi:histidinol-phosphatase (PHP family)